MASSSNRQRDVSIDELLAIIGGQVVKNYLLECDLEDLQASLDYELGLNDSEPAAESAPDTSGCRCQSGCRCSCCLADG